MEFQSVCITVVILVQLFQPSCQRILQSYYKVLKYTQFQDTTEDILSLSTHTLEGPVACACACNLHKTCTSVSYDTVLKTCRRNQHDVYTFGDHNITSSSHVHYLGKVQQDIKDGNWTLVFRGQSNNSQSMWKSFTNSSCRSDDDMADISLAYSSIYPDVTLPHFRSRWLDLWPSDAIDLVKVQLYKDGRADVNLTFNGTGSSQTNWFSLSRLVAVSPYTDLTSNISHFTVERKMNRIFVISNTSDYLNCSQQAWLIVEDLSSNHCYWSARSNWPRILYSASHQQTNFNNRTMGDNAVYRVADILVVFVKFLKRPST